MAYNASFNFLLYMYCIDFATIFSICIRGRYGTERFCIVDGCWGALGHLIRFVEIQGTYRKQWLNRSDE